MVPGGTFSHLVAQGLGKGDTCAESCDPSLLQRKRCVDLTKVALIFRAKSSVYQSAPENC